MPRAWQWDSNFSPERFPIGHFPPGYDYDVKYLLITSIQGEGLGVPDVSHPNLFVTRVSYPAFL